MPNFGPPPTSNLGGSSLENPEARFLQLEKTLEQFQVFALFYLLINLLLV
jgi:hypothetical protein